MKCVLIGILCKYLNKIIGREETTLHKLGVSKRKKINKSIYERDSSILVIICGGTL